MHLFKEPGTHVELGTDFRAGQLFAASKETSLDIDAHHVHRDWEILLLWCVCARASIDTYIHVKHECAISLIALAIVSTAYFVLLKISS